MLLRAVVLLFLCLSTGMCATIGHYLIKPVEEVPPVDSAAVADGVAAEDAAAPADTQLGNPPAVEEPAATSIFDENLLAKIVTANNPSADTPKADVPVADGATAEEPEIDSDRPAVNPPAMEAGDADHQDNDGPNNPSADNPEMDVPVVDGATDDGATAEEPQTDSERSAVNPPAMEADDADHQDSDVIPNNPSADNPNVDVPVVDGATDDGATAEEPQTDSERPAVDPPAMEAGDTDHQDSDVIPNNPSDANPNVDIPVVDGATADGATADGATAEEPETDSDRPAVDPPAMEAGDAGLQDNDIRPIETNQSPEEPVEDEDDNSWGLNSIRNSFQSIHGYFGSLVELAGGQNGVCQYRCRYEQPARPRPGFQHPEPNGCSSSLVGFQLDLGIPAMTTCCNQHDMCYDTCGTNKDDCDSEFRLCLHGICGDLKKSLGFVSKVQACESVADALHGTVGTLGCRPYMNSQRAACVCEDEERDEL